MHLLCYANLLAWKANGDPRTDNYALKKDPSKYQAPLIRGVHEQIQKIFRQGGVHPPYPTDRIGQVSDREVRVIS